ncbi:OTU domain-containing protein 2 [Grifola frondosa]|uniref:OTU domain-containing protein 2 n=1 Tax=Grifola frondosa TaxID=5627 RepID=A0A1C7MEY9_GRIFR|nr:OTU domain-containing protein 2 [Grifola frondosa]
MAGSKRNKIKKMFSAPPPPEPTVDDDELLDDLMAQLDSKSQTTREESATVLNEMHIDKVADDLETGSKQDSKSRFKARQVGSRFHLHERDDGTVDGVFLSPQARKAAALVETFAPTDANADAKLEKEAAEERERIKHMCDNLGLEIFDITPDGHCLFSAVADQLAILGVLPAEQATYMTCRQAAVNYIQSHPDDFIPFLPSIEGEDAAGATANTGLMGQAQFERYCATMRDTGAWGGEPEILALSKAFNVPIHVVQGGKPPVVVHDPSGSPEHSHTKSKHVVHISYHRRLYGLGEVRLFGPLLLRRTHTLIASTTILFGQGSVWHTA